MGAGEDSGDVGEEEENKQDNPSPAERERLGEGDACGTRHPHPNLSREAGEGIFAHGPITSRAPALAPFTPPWYIISAVPGGSVKLPTVPALARKRN